ncbi:MAG TPA: PaaI family thioesterase [Pyrinomonadaceae bacterium]
MSHPANRAFKEDIERGFARQSVMKLIGAELHKVEPGIVEIRLPFRADLAQQDGYIHAGIITTIADSACGFAAFTLMPAGSGVLSVEFKVNFLRPARGIHFVARGEVVKPGRTLTVAHGEVLAFSDAREPELIAMMQGTMMCVLS